MTDIFKNITVALKGFLMGAANVVPGVSGGTMALITGIYRDIVDALDSVMEPATWKALRHGRFREFWKCVNGNFLLWLCIGVVASIFSLAKAVTAALENYPVHIWALFFGLIIASSLLMLRDIKGWGVKEAIFLIVGAVLGLVVCNLSPTETPDAYWFLFLCGAVSICTMILPGISGSFVLVILGKYDYVMNAVAVLDVKALAVFGAGCVIGILAFSKILHYLLDHYQKATMIVLLGFVLGSLVKVWPWANETARALPEPHYLAAAIWCVTGIAAVALIEYFNRKVGKNQNID